VVSKSENTANKSRLMGRSVGTVTSVCAACQPQLRFLFICCRMPLIITVSGATEMTNGRVVSKSENTANKSRLMGRSVGTVTSVCEACQPQLRFLFICCRIPPMMTVSGATEMFVVS